MEEALGVAASQEMRCDLRPGNYLKHEHPFLKKTICHYFATLEAASQFIREQK
jgi:hypothetical protein